VNDTLRLMVYDRTCRGRGPLPGLTHSWWTGAHLYKLLGRFDAFHGASTWTEALAWLGTISADRPISEIQYWGHGHFGGARIGTTTLDAAILEERDPRHGLLCAVRDRLVEGGEALWWWRTCDTFGAVPGHAFAERFTGFMGAASAGHTFIIGPWQSGLHRLAPGERPSWPASEGLAEGTPEAPVRSRWSKPGEPNTVTCFAGRIPAGF